MYFFYSLSRYVQLEELGNGTYGSVLLGQRVDTGEKVISLIRCTHNDGEGKTKFNVDFS